MAKERIYSFFLKHVVTSDTDFIILITFNEVLESYIAKLHTKSSKFVSAQLRRVITSEMPLSILEIEKNIKYFMSQHKLQVI